MTTIVMTGDIDPLLESFYSIYAVSLVSEEKCQSAVLVLAMINFM